MHLVNAFRKGKYLETSCRLSGRDAGSPVTRIRGARSTARGKDVLPGLTRKLSEPGVFIFPSGVYFILSSVSVACWYCGA